MSNPLFRRSSSDDLANEVASIFEDLRGESDRWAESERQANLEQQNLATLNRVRTDRRMEKIEKMLMERAEDKRHADLGNKLSFGLGLATDLLGGYFVDRAFDQAVEEGKDRFRTQVEPLLEERVGTTKELQELIQEQAGRDPYAGAVRETAATARAAGSAALAQSGVRGGPAEDRLLAEAYEVLRGEVAAMNSAAATGKGARAVRHGEAILTGMNLEAADLSNAAETARVGWDGVYRHAEQEAADMAALIDSLSAIGQTIVSAYTMGLFPRGGGTPPLPGGGGGGADWLSIQFPPIT